MKSSRLEEDKNIEENIIEDVRNLYRLKKLKKLKLLKIIVIIQRDMEVLLITYVI